VARFCQPMTNKWQPFKFDPRLLKLSVKVSSKNLVRLCFFYIHGCWL
jgi:hypothetical protein